MGVLRLVAIIVFAVAFLGAADIISGVNILAWLTGGLLAWCASETYDRVIPVRTPPNG